MRIRTNIEWPAFEIDRTRVDWICSKDRAGCFCATRSQQTSHSDDLAAPDFNCHITQLAPTRQVLGTDERGAVCRRGFVIRESSYSLSQLLAPLTQHQADEIELLKTRELTRTDQFAIAQNGHAVTHRIKLVKTVADVDNRGALFSQTSNHIVEDVNFVLSQRTGRFIQHYYLCSERNTTRNCHHLPERDIQTAECCARIDFQAQTFQQSGCVRVHTLPINQTPPPRFPSEINVFGDRAK